MGFGFKIGLSLGFDFKMGFGSLKKKVGLNKIGFGLGLGLSKFIWAKIK
jgi:hypothetical protein